MDIVPKLVVGHENLNPHLLNKRVQGPINLHNPLGTRDKTKSAAIFAADTTGSEHFNAKRWMSRATVIGLGTDIVPTPMQHNDICPIRC